MASNGFLRWISLHQTVTLTLQELEDGKVNLHLEQSGFSNNEGLEGAKYDWSNWVGELEKVLGH